MPRFVDIAKGLARPHGLKPRRATWLLALVVVVALLTVAPIALADSASPAPAASGFPPTDNGLTYRIGIQGGVDNMNPFSTYMTLPWECFRVCYNFLTWYDASFQPVPDLATEVPSVANGGITEGGKVWTYHLRHNVKWSDGVPLTAQDVSYTFNRILRQQLGMYIGYFEHVTKVEAPDDYTVVITSSKPNAVMTALYVPILPEHIWNKVPDKKAEYWSNMPMVSSGPFFVSEVHNGKFVKLTRNPYYEDGFGVEPTVQTVLYEMYQQQSSMVDDYKSGNLDAAIELAPGFYRALKTTPGTTLTDAPSLGFHQLGMNCYKSPKSKGNPLLRDVHIRQAVNYAIDKQKVANTAMAGLAPVATSILSPVQGFYRWDVPADQQYTYDPAKAKQILDAAGYKIGPGGVRVAPNGKPVKFRLAALTDYPMDVTASKLISGYLKAVGIGVTLQVMDEAAFTNDNYDNANDDLYIWNWNADIDPGYILSIFTTGQLLNGSDSEYSNPAYDKLYTAQAAAVIPADRQAIIQKMQQILYRDAVYDVLWYNVLIQAYRTDKWTGYETVPPGAAGAPFRNMLRTSYIDLKPKTVAATESGGSSTGVIVGVVVAVVVVIGIVVLLLRRRRPQEAEVE